MSDPDNQHASVTAFYEWYKNRKSQAQSDAFLAGWKMGLMRAAGNFEITDPAYHHLIKCADATPDQLP